MTEFSMTLTRTEFANEQVQSIARGLASDEQGTKSGLDVLSALYESKTVCQHLRQFASGCEESLTRRAKKIDLQPKDETAQYGIGLTRAGAVEFWVQNSFVG